MSGECRDFLELWLRKLRARGGREEKKKKKRCRDFGNSLIGKLLDLLIKFLLVYFPFPFGLYG